MYLILKTAGAGKRLVILVWRLPTLGPTVLLLSFRKFTSHVVEAACKNVTVLEEGFIQKRRQISSLLLGGENSFNSLPRLLIFTRMI